MALAFSNPLSRCHWLPAPLAIWGKLPSHGDFLRHRCTAEQARGWQCWVGSVWSQRPATAQATRPRRAVRSEPGWLTLEPRKVVADLGAVPVAFVMQPGALPFAPAHCVQGVMLASVDQVGRPCPLIIFQTLAPTWLRRSWAPQGAPSQPDMLYWLARIAARAHAAQRDWETLVAAIDAVWQAHAPGWRHVLGAALPAPERAQLDAVLQRYCALEAADAAFGLQGVQRMPWAHWPAHILRQQQPLAAFWQQDVRGGYINAAENLPALWGAKA